MSVHRRVCVSVVPSLVPAAPDGHTHQCVHEPEPFRPLFTRSSPEHECACGMTWTESTVTMEEQRGPGIWPLVAALAIAALVAAAIIWTAGL